MRAQISFLFDAYCLPVSLIRVSLVVGSSCPYRMFLASVIIVNKQANTFPTCPKSLTQNPNTPTLICFTNPLDFMVSRLLCGQGCGSALGSGALKREFEFPLVLSFLRRHSFFPVSLLGGSLWIPLLVGHTDVIASATPVPTFITHSHTK